MAKSLPVISAPELRALDIFHEVPLGCILHIEASDMHAPHLLAGEFAVIDPADRALRYGELYLIRHDGGPRIRQIGRLDGVMGGRPGEPSEPFATLGGLRRDWFEIAPGHAVYMTDGHHPISQLQREIIGRVAGIFQAGEPERDGREGAAAPLRIPAAPAGWARGDALRFSASEPFDAARWVAWAEAWGYSFSMHWHVPREWEYRTQGPAPYERFVLSERSPAVCHHPDDIALWQVRNPPDESTRAENNRAVENYVMARSDAANVIPSLS